MKNAALATASSLASGGIAAVGPDPMALLAAFDPTAILQLAPAIVSLIYWIRVLLGKDKAPPAPPVTKLPGDL